MSGIRCGRGGSWNYVLLQNVSIDISLGARRPSDGSITLNLVYHTQVDIFQLVEQLLVAE